MSSLTPRDAPDPIRKKRKRSNSRFMRAALTEEARDRERARWAKCGHRTYDTTAPGGGIDPDFDEMGE